MGNDVAICKKDSIEIIPVTSYLRLCSFIFGGSFKSTMQAVNSMDTIILNLLETLTESENKIVRERFGLNNDENPKTLETVGEILGLTKERVRQIETKAIRKLRHPSRSGYIRNGNMGINYSIGYDSSYYTDRLNEILLEELKRVVERGDSKNVFLGMVLKKNEITLNKRTVVDAEEISLEELGLQVRSFNCLKRSGIDNLQQLMAMDDEDLKRVRNLGTKSYEEIKEKIDGYEEGINIDGSITIEYEQNNEKTVYKFIGEDNEKITKAIYKIIFCNVKNGKNIFSSKYSPGLKELLLLKGYVYIKDVDRDAEMLIKQLRMADFECFAKEIEETKKYSTYCKNESEPVYVMFLEENEHSDFIRKNQGKTILELQELVKDMENTEIKNCIDVLASYLV